MVGIRTTGQVGHQVAVHIHHGHRVAAAVGHVGQLANRLPDHGQRAGTDLHVSLQLAIGGVQNLQVVGALRDNEQQFLFRCIGDADGALGPFQVVDLLDLLGGLVDHVDLVGGGHHEQLAAVLVQRKAQRGRRSLGAGR